MAIGAALVATLGSKLLGAGVDLVKSIFGFKEKKLDLQVFEQTSDRDLQIAWWDYLKSASSTIVNQVIRPVTMACILGDLFYQLWWTGTYKIVVIMPSFKIGDWTFGPITNGVLVCFVILFLFPLRSVEKILMRKN